MQISRRLRRIFSPHTFTALQSWTDDQLDNDLLGGKFDTSVVPPATATGRHPPLTRFMDRGSNSQDSFGFGSDALQHPWMGCANAVTVQELGG